MIVVKQKYFYLSCGLFIALAAVSNCSDHQTNGEEEYSTSDDGEALVDADDGGWDDGEEGGGWDDGGAFHDTDDAPERELFEETWRFTDIRYIAALPPAVSDNRIFFVGGGDDIIGFYPYHLFGLRSNGEEDWSEEEQPSVPIIDGLGRVVICKETFSVYNSDGSVVCTSDLFCDTKLALSAESRVLVVSSNELLEVSTEQCTVEKRIPILSGEYSAPVIGENGQIFLSGTQALVSLDSNWGELWTNISFRASSESLVSDGNMAVDNEGSLVIVTRSSILAKLSPLNETLWSENLASCTVSAPVVDSNGNIYLGGLRGLVSFDKDGSFRWAYRNGIDDSLSSCAIGLPPAPIVESDGSVVYLSMLDMTIAKLDSDGNILGEKTIDGGITFECPYVGSISAFRDGVLVGNCRSSLINLYRQSSELDTSWSTFRGNVRNTGNINF